MAAAAELKFAKRIKVWKEKLKPGKYYTVDEALGLVKEFATAKFSESVDVAVNLGIDAGKSDQQVRGSTVMPHGIGKTVRVAVFTGGKNADAAREAGADLVGLEDLAEKVKAGQIDFDVVVASPDAMRVVGQLGQILGPRGLMPNPKVGTVTPDVAGAVRNAKAGQVRYRVDKAGIVHCTIGKATFEADKLKENLLALLQDLQKHKPSTSKGVYLKKLTVSSTMGPGVTIDQATLGLGSEVMALNLEQKKGVVAEVNAVAAVALSVVGAENKGLTVTQVTDLRVKARAQGVYLRVIKNTLARKAVAGTPYECIGPALKGPLMLAFSKDDPGAAARVMKEFTKGNDKLVPRLVSLGGQLLPGTALDQVASLPTRDQALAMLMGVMKAPIQKLVGTLAAAQLKLVRTLVAVKDQKQAAG